MKAKTLRVRIAVANDGTDWGAFGWSQADGKPSSERAAKKARELVADDARIVWVEADVPIEETPTLEGQVKP